MILPWDHSVIREFWLLREYLPAAAETDARLALTPKHRLRAGLAQLRADLASGAWATRHADLLDKAALDLGYRLITADKPT